MKANLLDVAYNIYLTSLSQGKGALHISTIPPAAYGTIYSIINNIGMSQTFIKYEKIILNVFITMMKTAIYERKDV